MSKKELTINYEQFEEFCNLLCVMASDAGMSPDEAVTDAPHFITTYVPELLKCLNISTIETPLSPKEAFNDWAFNNL